METYLGRYNHLYVYSEGTAGVLVYLRSFTRPKAVLQKFNLYPAQKRVPGPETGLSTQNHYLAVHLSIHIQLDIHMSSQVWLYSYS